MTLVKYIFLFLLVFAMGNSYAQKPVQKQMACKEKLLEEFKNTMSSDNGLIQAQLTLTAMKLAKKVLGRKVLKELSITAYIQDIVGEKTIARFDNSSEIQNDIRNVFNKYSGSSIIPDGKVQLERLRWQDRMSDEDVAKYMIQMSEIWKGQDYFGFDQSDIAMAWFVNTAQKKLDGNDSYFISNTINEVLKDVNKSEAIIATNFKKAQLKLKAELQKLKLRIFEQYKEECLDLYSQNTAAQNTSTFGNISCGVNEISLLEDLFVTSLQDILSGIENPRFKPSPLQIELAENIASPSQVRLIQDWINKKESDKEKILEFYKTGLASNKCDGFLITDKENNTTSLYLNDGTEIMTSPAIMGEGKMSKKDNGEQKEFNSDSILRKWPVADGKYKYSKTTGSGIFYVDKSLTPKERSQRKYDQEFNDRVLVLYTKQKDGKIREEVQAIHGVPNTGWIGNRNTRMNAFAKPDANKKLSTGCVNLEGYTFDIMNEFIGNQCPVYILPEDPKNYFVVKNGQLDFSTSNYQREMGNEKSSIIMASGNKIIDEKNVNQYNFTPINKRITVLDYDKSKIISDVMDKIFHDKEELIKRASQMENDDFEDFAALTYALTNKDIEAKQIFLDLYSSLYRFKMNSSDLKREEFDKASVKQKRKMILESYANEFNKEIDMTSTLTKASEVHYVQ